MKIKNQFVMLILGIIVVPLIIMSALFLFAFYREPERTLLPGYREVNGMSGTDISKDDWAKLSRLISRKPNSIDYLIIDEKGTVVFSTIAEHPAGSAIPDAELIDRIKTTNRQYLYQLDSPSTQEPFTVITRILRESRRPPNPLTAFIHWIIAVFLIFLVFSAVMSFFIARSITRSVTILEESTRRIAAGELDVAIDAKGSNEITSLTISLNRMRLSLKDEQARRSRFIMGISHDLKTPLALIKGYTEAISDGLADDPATLEKSLAIIGNKVNQLEEMIDDLIGFVKLNTGEWRQHLSHHSLEPILNSFSQRISSDANLLKRTIEYRIDIPAAVVVPLDERLFVRALENITTNAIRYTQENGLVRIDARMEGTDAVLTVSDNGSGIRAEDLPHIFDLFYRGSNSRREEGLGLGLSIVKSVADSHGWSVSAESDPGRLTVFTIRIPSDPQDREASS